MEDILRLYAKPENAKEPVVCLDERPVQLLAPERAGLPMKPGKVGRYDYEYVRHGTANVFCIVEPLTGRRQTHATKTRTGLKFAHALKRIATRHRKARTIHLVLDNLSTHTSKGLKAAYGERAGAKLWSRFTVHYTPKHASWLNAAEMEVSLVSRECLGTRRISELPVLQREVSAWNSRADRQRRAIRWRFRVNDARRVFRYSGIATARSKH